MKTQSKILYLMFFYTMFFSCKNSNDMVEFKSVIFENRKFVEEDITEPGFYNNLKIVLDYYGVDYEFKNDVIYVQRDRKSTRLNSSHVAIAYAVFCLKHKKTN